MVPGVFFMVLGFFMVSGQFFMGFEGSGYRVYFRVCLGLEFIRV